MRAALPLLLTLWACADPSASPTPNTTPPELDFRIADAAVDALALVDAEPDRGPAPDAAPPPPDAALDMIVDEGVLDASAECDDDVVRCPVPGAPAIETCRMGRWQQATCPPGDVCLDARCLPDPQGCGPDARICLTIDQPATCEADAWRPGPRCPEGRRCRAGACETIACAEAAEAGSYLGCEFLTVPLPNFAAIYTPGTPMGLVVANPHDAAVRLSLQGAADGPAPLVGAFEVTLSDNPLVPEEAPDLYQPQIVRSAVRDADGAVVADGFEQALALEVPPGGTATLLLAPSGEEALLSQVLPLARRLISDRPVAAYQFGPYCCNFSFSNDASLLFPVAALGRTYHVAAPPNFVYESLDSPGAVAIAAPSDGTVVEVQLPRGARIRTLNDAQVEVLAADHYRARLDALDVLMINTARALVGDPPPDLTGAVVEASAPVAVFSSHLCTFYPQAVGFCDHLEEQLPPVEAWGQRYALVPPPPRARAHNDGQRVYYRLLAAAPGVTLTLSRPLGALELGPPGAPGIADCAAAAVDDTHLRLDAPCELSVRVPLGLVADAPIQVMATLSGQEALQLESPFGTRAGDPALYLVPPDRQLRTTYDFLVPDTYALDFVTVTAPAAARITLDGAPVPLAAATAVPGTARVFRHVPLTDGAHHIEGDRPFAIRVTAFDDFVSYAFTGGLDLRKP